MDDYAGRVLADRYRLPLPPSDEYELTETRAFDTYSGQEVLVRQVPLPEVVEAEVLDADGLPDGFTARDRGSRRPPAARSATRRPTDPAVRRAVEAAQAAARIPDHARLDQVFDVFAEGGSLWIVSECVTARPLSALLAERPLTPYRAAEVASDVLMALRVLHAHGWVHRNITARTVLVCDDGRVMLTGLAVGAAEEALSGYDPVPAPEEPEGTGPQSLAGPGGLAGPGASTGPRDSTWPGGGAGPGGPGGPGSAVGGVGPGGSAASGVPGSDARRPGGVGGGFGGGAPEGVDAEAARRAAIQARAVGGRPVPGAEGADGAGPPGEPGRPALESGGDIRAARAGAIAAYRAGARAAARVQEAQQNGRAALPGARPPTEADPGAAARADGSGPAPYAPGLGVDPRPGGTPPGQIADPYGVRATPWHGTSPRSAPGEDRQRTALPPGGAVHATPHAPGARGGPGPALPPAAADGRSLPAAADGRTLPVGVVPPQGGRAPVPPAGAPPAADAPLPAAPWGEAAAG
ncbi:protein kinase, partial [Streptomyces sp. NPDC001508]|uniref:protein kinase n=1 Tax=Streptomyces sp. NPDC001508 TaxID=3154656 RepID=UPI0033168EDB